MMDMEEPRPDNEGLISWLKNTGGFFGRHTMLWLEILVFILLYIANRYAYQRDRAVVETLKRELVDMEYQSLGVTSDVSAKSKRSYIEKIVEDGNTGLSTGGESPYILPK